MIQRQQPESMVDACCSFCGKQQHQVEHLTAGPSGVRICNECVYLCWKTLEERGAIDLFSAKSPFFLSCPLVVQVAAVPITSTFTVV